MSANIYLLDYRSDLIDKLADVAGIDLSRQVITKGQIRDGMVAAKKTRS